MAPTASRPHVMIDALTPKALTLVPVMTPPTMDVDPVTFRACMLTAAFTVAPVMAPTDAIVVPVITPPTMDVPVMAPT